MKNQKGFSLIELLIVVVIIGIIAAIAIPNLLAARRSANEGSATSAMRNLHSAQTTYQATAGNGQYAATLLELGPQTGGAGLLDRTLANAGVGVGNPGKSGYFFETAGVVATPPTFHASACPVTPVIDSTVTGTGTRHFGMTQVGAIYAGPAPSGNIFMTATDLAGYDDGTVTLPAGYVQLD